MRRQPQPRRPLAALLLLAAASLSAPAWSAPDAMVWAGVQQQQQPLLATLEDLVAIESGSGDREGLDRISQVIADRLTALGGRVEFIEPGADAYRMHDSPRRIGRMVRASFTGSGSKKILLIAHMDTVYLRGMGARQPFRIAGNRAYGLGIGDDKAGVAVILHTLATLQELGFKDYGLLTVLINGDEEISSPGSRALLSQLGAEHDLTLSHEGSPASSDQLSLATAGIAAVTLKVTGKASHAGAAPERGLNAIYELAHQMLQTKDFSDPSRGLKLNWTMVSGGSNRNVIPAEASAAADVRVDQVADYDGLEARLRQTITRQLIPGTTLDLRFERRRPPLQAQPGQLPVARQAQAIYAELGKTLKVVQTVAGGGTDAAFAALNTPNPVLERFGLLGFGAHSSDDEYILVDSIAPRLYLATRLIMDFSRGRVP
jgi:glutamate carboxypeptidase